MGRRSLVPATGKGLATHGGPNGRSLSNASSPSLPGPGCFGAVRKGCLLMGHPVFPYLCNICRGPASVTALPDHHFSLPDAAPGRK